MLGPDEDRRCFCPQCGSAYLRGPHRRRRVSRKLALLLLCAVVLAGGGVGVAVKISNDRDAQAKHAAAVAGQAQKDAEARRVADAAAAKDAADGVERSRRADIVTALQASILKDAKARANPASPDYAYLTGPILHVLCTPLGGGSVDDLTALTGTFECTAVNKTKDDGSEEGYRFSAAVNWTAATYSWHLGS